MPGISGRAPCDALAMPLPHINKWVAARTYLGALSLAASSAGTVNYTTLRGLRGARRARFSGAPPCEGQASPRKEIGPCFHGKGNITELNNSVIFCAVSWNSGWNRNGRTRARTRTASPFSDESPMTLWSPRQMPVSVSAVAVALTWSLDSNRANVCFLCRRFSGRKGQAADSSMANDGARLRQLAAHSNDEGNGKPEARMPGRAVFGVGRFGLLSGLGISSFVIELWAA